MNRSGKRRRGSAIIEFTLVGIPLIFVLISIFEVARGMWIYHTLAYAVTEGTRYASVHGINCTTSPNTCGTTIAGIAGVIQYAAAGMVPGQMSLTFIPSSGTAVGPCTVTSCLTMTGTAWPPSGANIPGMTVTIQATYPFSSAIAMFWPGAGGSGIVFPTFNLPATSTERIQF